MKRAISTLIAITSLLLIGIVNRMRQRIRLRSSHSAQKNTRQELKDCVAFGKMAPTLELDNRDTAAKTIQLEQSTCSPSQDTKVSIETEGDTTPKLAIAEEKLTSQSLPPTVLVSSHADMMREEKLSEQKAGIPPPKDIDSETLTQVGEWFNSTTDTAKSLSTVSVDDVKFPLSEAVTQSSTDIQLTIPRLDSPNAAGTPQSTSLTTLETLSTTDTPLNPISQRSNSEGEMHFEATPVTKVAETAGQTAATSAIPEGDSLPTTPANPTAVSPTYATIQEPDAHEDASRILTSDMSQPSETSVVQIALAPESGSESLLPGTAGLVDANVADGPTHTDQSTTLEPSANGPNTTAADTTERVPRQYRPQVTKPVLPQKRRTPANSGQMPDARNRALPIELRLIFEKAGFCQVSLLPRRSEILPPEIAISGTGEPPELIALQDNWYQDLLLPEISTLLRTGIEWKGIDPTGQTTRWSLAGREIYVLAPHDDLNGFVSTTRLILGEKHVVLCTEGRLDEVIHAIELTGSPKPEILNSLNGIPAGWVGLNRVVPCIPIPPNSSSDILNVLCPLDNVEIVLEGGIRIDRSTWLTGFPPVIRLRGENSATSALAIDSCLASFDVEKSSYVAPGWDTPGQHVVQCTSASRIYTIQGGIEHWEPWDGYTWSLGEFNSGSENVRPSICGSIIRPPQNVPSESHAVITPSTNAVILGAVPGEIQTINPRHDLRTGMCIGFVCFEPVWAVPTDAYHCDKQTTRVMLIGDYTPPRVDKLPYKVKMANGGKRFQKSSFTSAPTKRIQAWYLAILSAGRKGLPVEPANAENARIWEEFRSRAKSIWRAMK